MKKNKSTKCLDSQNIFNIKLLPKKKNESMNTSFRKVFKGPVHTAYNKDNFGSIPSSVENVLFKAKDKLKISKIKKNSIKKDLDVLIEGDNIKYSFSSRLPKSCSSVNLFESKDIFKNKKSKFFGGETRFDSFKREITKYYPGPGEYDPDNSKPLFSTNRYQSLFKKNKDESVIFKEKNNLGPGSYDPYLNDTTKGKNIIFMKEKKFNDLNGPFSIKNSNTRTGPGYINLPSGFQIKRAHHPSYFFMKETKGSMSPEDKIYNLTGLNLTRSRNLINRDNSFDQVLNQKIINETKPVWIKEELHKKMKEMEKKQTELINEEEKELIRKKNLIKYQREILKYAMFSPKSKKGFTFDLSPRGNIFTKNHVPGPSYYDHNNILSYLKSKKVNFHSKDSTIWL